MKSLILKIKSLFFFLWGGVININKVDLHEKVQFPIELVAQDNVNPPVTAAIAL